MTLYFDSRDGSIDLPKSFTDSIVVDGLPADVIFTGMGNGGVEKTVGIEFKKVSDLLSCICTGRFAGHQLPTMDAACDDYWLLVEGDVRCHATTGRLQIRKFRDVWTDAAVGNRQFMWTDVETWLITMQTKAGLKVKWTNNRSETVAWVDSLYRWWTRGWDSHHSDIVLNKSADRANISKPTHARMVAETLPGVGHGKAVRVAARFRSMFDMAVATPEQWMEVDGIGKAMANRIVATINNNGSGSDGERAGSGGK